MPEGNRRVVHARIQSQGRHRRASADEGRQAERAKLAEAIRPTYYILTGKSLHCIVFRVCVQGIKRHGGLAQLEERVLCKHEVTGSSPVFSTIWADSSVG